LLDAAANQNVLEARSFISSVARSMIEVLKLKRKLVDNGFVFHAKNMYRNLN